MKANFVRSALLVAGLALGAQAQAAILKCTASGSSALPGSPSYLLVLNLRDDKAAVFRSEGGMESWQVVYPEARSIMAADGGPLSVYGTDQTPIDWSKEDRCFVTMKPNYRFTLRLSSRGTTGTLGITPHLEMRPGAACPIPDLVLPAPVQLSCEEL